jgi:hypothetical protein
VEDPPVIQRIVTEGSAGVGALRPGLEERKAEYDSTRMRLRLPVVLAAIALGIVPSAEADAKVNKCRSDRSGFPGAIRLRTANDSCMHAHQVVDSVRSRVADMGRWPKYAYAGEDRYRCYFKQITMYTPQGGDWTYTRMTCKRGERRISARLVS